MFTFIVSSLIYFDKLKEVEITFYLLVCAMFFDVTCIGMMIYG